MQLGGLGGGGGAVTPTTGSGQKNLQFSRLYWPEMPYSLIVSMSLALKNVFLFLQELLLP